MCLLTDCSLYTLLKAFRNHVQAIIHMEGPCHLLVYNTTEMIFQGPELSLNHLSFLLFSLVKPVVHPTIWVLISAKFIMDVPDGVVGYGEKPCNFLLLSKAGFSSGETGNTFLVAQQYLCEDWNVQRTLKVVREEMRLLMWVAQLQPGTAMVAQQWGC